MEKFIYTPLFNDEIELEKCQYNKIEKIIEFPDKKVKLCGIFYFNFSQPEDYVYTYLRLRKAGMKNIEYFLEWSRDASKLNYSTLVKRIEQSNIREECKIEEIKKIIKLPMYGLDENEAPVNDYFDYLGYKIDVLAEKKIPYI